MNDFIDEIKKQYNLGATGKYPYGDKIIPSDKGELKSAVVRKGDNIIIVFGKPIEWVSLTRKGAKDLGMKLIDLSNKFD